MWRLVREIRLMCIELPTTRFWGVWIIALIIALSWLVVLVLKKL